MQDKCEKSGDHEIVGKIQDLRVWIAKLKDQGDHIQHQLQDGDLGDSLEKLKLLQENNNNLR